LPSFCGFACQ